MNVFESVTKSLTWFMALLIVALVAGCGGGGGGDANVSGGDNAALVPMVTAVTPLPGAGGVPINTVAITASFTKMMDPATLTPASFILACPAGAPVTGEAVTYLATGNMVTLRLPTATSLPANTLCTATVTAGAMDATGIPLASNFTWTFTTGAVADTTPPMVTDTIHASGEKNVAINTQVGATFSEGMDPLTITNVNFTLKETVTGNAVTGTVSYSGVSAVFMPMGNLVPNTGYTVTVKGGASGVKDLAGNPMASDFIIRWTTAAAPDAVAPMVTGTIHANGATNVAINTQVGATFSEGMDPLTITNANFTLKETVTGNAVSGTVSYSGVSAEFMPMSNLVPNTGYTVTVKGGVSGIKDLAGNPMASDFIIRWITAAATDATAPTVIGTIHANGAINVAINTKAGATFSEGMDPLTLSNVNFTLKKTATGAAVAGTVSYSGLLAVFTIWNDGFGPAIERFSPGTSYTATIKGGVDGVKDLAGNPMASDYEWSWTTGTTSDYVNPTVSSTAPQANAAGVAINGTINATFSEAMDPLTITTINFKLLEGGISVAGTVFYDIQSNIATFTPLNPLVRNTTYVALISGVTDLAGNVLASGLAPIPWSFTTAATP